MFSSGKLDKTLSTYKSFFNRFEVCDGFNFKCFKTVAFKINGEQVVPNKTTLKRYVINGLFGSLELLNHKNRVTSRSFSSSSICKNAFSISVDTTYLLSRNLAIISVKSLIFGGTDIRQSFKLTLSEDSRQLQSYTIRIGVVNESSLTA